MMNKHLFSEGVSNIDVDAVERLLQIEQDLEKKRARRKFAWIKPLLIAAALALLLGVVFFGTSSADLLTKFRQDKRTALVSALLFCVSILCLGRNSVFIYFNF